VHKHKILNTSSTILESAAQINFKSYKNIFKLYQDSEITAQLGKKRMLYRMNRGFNKRFYASRLVVRSAFFKKNTKQFVLTNFLEKYKAGKTNIHKSMQMFLYVTLLHCQFFFTRLDCIHFLKKYGAFVNGKLCTNPYKIVKKGDIIQIPVFNNFFLYNKKYSKILFFFLKRYRSKFNKIFASKKKTRTRSRHMPS